MTQLKYLVLALAIATAGAVVDIGVKYDGCE